MEMENNQEDDDLHSLTPHQAQYIHPFKALREHHNITQEQLANAAGTTSQSILRYEQGLYEKPSEKIIDALVKLSGVAAPKLLLRYEYWRLAHQERAAPVFAANRPLLVKAGEHPFVTFRSSLGYESRMAFCKLLAIHPSVVAEYEKGNQKHIPRMIKNALINGGCRRITVDQLDQFGVIYYERIRL